MNVAAPPTGTLERLTDGNRAHLSRLARAGRAMRLTRGIYVVGASLPPERVAWHHRFAVIAATWPGAVLCGRTALAGGEPVGGVMYVAHADPRRTTDLTIPGLVVRVQVGPARLPGDMAFPEGLWLSGAARRLVENVNVRGRPRPSVAGTRAVEDAIDDLARTGGAGRVQAVLQELDVIAGSFDPPAVATVRALLAAVLGTFSGGVARIGSERLRSRLLGMPFDQQRVDMLKGLVSVLEERAPAPRAARPGDPRWQWLPFFEAYFSNFIEGTEFGVEEARAIAIDGAVPPARPADAHDVAATYRLASDAREAARVPRSGDELVDLLRERHAVLMASRPEKRPGELKVTPNFAGGYQFVDPALVVGTLREGFALLDTLVDPFARAVATMLLVTECHPFDDGNGRVARLAANAELSAAGQVRFVIPTVYRNDYLAALNGVSHGAGRGESLVAVLAYAQRWTAAVRWTTFEDAHADLGAANAYVDPRVADQDGTRLVLPPRV